MACPQPAPVAPRQRLGTPSAGAAFAEALRGHQADIARLAAALVRANHGLVLQRDRDDVEQILAVALYGIWSEAGGLPDDWQLRFYRAGRARVRAWADHGAAVGGLSHASGMRRRAATAAMAETAWISENGRVPSTAELLDSMHPAPSPAPAAARHRSQGITAHDLEIAKSPLPLRDTARSSWLDPSSGFEEAIVDRVDMQVEIDKLAAAAASRGPGRWVPRRAQVAATVSALENCRDPKGSPRLGRFAALWLTAAVDGLDTSPAALAEVVGISKRMADRYIAAIRAVAAERRYNVASGSV